MFLTNLIAAAGQAFADWRHKQKAYAELMSLDDRSLADIGIRRCEIPAIVEGHRETSPKQLDSEFIPAFNAQRLASGHTWFPWFPPL